MCETNIVYNCSTRAGFAGNPLDLATYITLLGALKCSHAAAHLTHVLPKVGKGTHEGTEVKQGDDNSVMYLAITGAYPAYTVHMVRLHTADTV